MKKIILLLSISAFLACDNVTPATPIENLTGTNVKAWKLEDYSNNGSSIFTDCLKDDVFFFYKNTNEYLWKKGNLKCDANDVDQKFTYEISEDGKILKINGTDWQIKSLSEKNLEIEASLFSGSLFNIKYVAI